MHVQLAPRLHREAHAERPALSAELHDRIVSQVAAEPARPRAEGREPAGWLGIQAGIIVLIAAITFAAPRGPQPGSVAADGTDASPATVPPAAAATATAPLDELLDDLQTEMRDMAAALIGIPDWNAPFDLDAAVAMLTPPPVGR